MLTVVLTVALTAILYLVANYADVSAKTMNFYRTLRTRQQVSSIRNLLIDDAVQNGGTMRPPDGISSPPAAVIGVAYPAPVIDAWGGDIIYCTYNISPPVMNLAARLTSSGKNRIIETACSDTAAKGDDIISNIFLGDLKPFVSGGGLADKILPSSVSMIDARGSNSSYAIYGLNLIAWGLNTSGQAGINLTSYNPRRPEFATVGSKGDFLTNIRLISAGGTHVLAVKSDGTVWAWGAGGSGRLGNGSTSNSSYPVQTKVTSTTYLTNVSAISAGGSHSMAIKADGTVLTWGYNNYGQLGIGSSDTGAHSYPLSVAGLSNIIAVSAGGGHSIALMSDGTVWTWGQNTSGQLGIGTTDSTAHSIPVQITGLSNIIAVSAGGSHSMALGTDGTVWTWGLNSSGQLGDGTTTQRTSPVQIAGLSNIIAVSAGGSHSIALVADGTVWTWGLNSSGQLGDGTMTSPRQTPVQVSGLSNVSVISAGVAHSLALVHDTVGGKDIIYAWGSNSSGQLGDCFLPDGSICTSSPDPVKVQLPVMELF